VPTKIGHVDIGELSMLEPITLSEEEAMAFRFSENTRALSLISIAVLAAFALGSLLTTIIGVSDRLLFVLAVLSIAPVQVFMENLKVHARMISQVTKRITSRVETVRQAKLRLNGAGRLVRGDCTERFLHVSDDGYERIVLVTDGALVSITEGETNGGEGVSFAHLPEAVVLWPEENLEPRELGFGTGQTVLVFAPACLTELYRVALLE
jgi:hypothetical protein